MTFWILTNKWTTNATRQNRYQTLPKVQNIGFLSNIIKVSVVPKEDYLKSTAGYFVPDKYYNFWKLYQYDSVSHKILEEEQDQRYYGEVST